MIHGICSTPRHFDFLLPSIPEDVSLCNILLAGHGGTVEDFSRTSMKEWKAQVCRFLDMLSETHERIIVVGYSLGTLLALNFWQDYPKVKGLLLLNPPLAPFLKPLMLTRTVRISYGKPDLKDSSERAMYQDLSIRLTPYSIHYLSWIPKFVALLRLCYHCRKNARRLTINCSVLLGNQDELVATRSGKFFPKEDFIRCETFQNSTHCYYEPKFIEATIDSIRWLLGQTN